MARIRVNDSIAGGARYQRVTESQCARMHEASLAILERTGACLHDQEAIDLLAAAGASVSDGNRVRFPPQLVEQALSTVPRRLTLVDRNGERPLQLEGGRCYYGTGSDCLHIIDHRDGERRKAVLDDVRDGITVSDALPNVDFAMSMFLPSDIDPMVTDRHQMRVMLEHTSKTLVFVTNEFSGCQDAVRMAEVVAGGADALRERPFVAHYINVTTGLQHNEDALQKLLFMADKGLPAMYVPVVISAVSGPVTPAGTIALVNAGFLVGVVVSQLRREGAPLIYPGWGAEGLDMRTAVNPYCAPDPRGWMHAMGNHYDLPVFGLGGCSDSKTVDAQSAAEAALTLAFETLGGANLIHDLGYLESGLTGSLVQLALCDELIEWLDHTTRPPVLDDEAFALDLIDTLGPEGQFLDSDHTLAHCRERWHPRLIDRGDYEQWQMSGGEPLEARAAARVERILSEHQPEPLSDEVSQALGAIVAEAERRHTTTEAR